MRCWSESPARRTSNRALARFDVTLSRRARSGTPSRRGSATRRAPAGSLGSAAASPKAPQTVLPDAASTRRAPPSPWIRTTGLRSGPWRWALVSYSAPRSATGLPVPRNCARPSAPRMTPTMKSSAAPATVRARCGRRVRRVATSEVGGGTAERRPRRRATCRMAVYRSHARGGGRTGHPSRPGSTVGRGPRPSRCPHGGPRSRARGGSARRAEPRRR